MYKNIDYKISILFPIILMIFISIINFFNVESVDYFMRLSYRIYYDYGLNFNEILAIKIINSILIFTKILLFFIIIKYIVIISIEKNIFNSLLIGIFFSTVIFIVLYILNPIRYSFLKDYIVSVFLYIIFIISSRKYKH